MKCRNRRQQVVVSDQSVSSQSPPALTALTTRQVSSCRLWFMYKLLFVVYMYMRGSAVRKRNRMSRVCPAPGSPRCQITVYRGSVPVRRHREPVKRHVFEDTGGARTTHTVHSKHRPGGHGHASRAQDQLRTGPRLTGGRAHAARTGQPSDNDTSRPTRRPTQERPPAHIVHNH